VGRVEGRDGGDEVAALERGQAEVAVHLFNQNVAEIRPCAGASMYPTLSDRGTLVLHSPLAHCDEELQEAMSTRAQMQGRVHAPGMSRERIWTQS
jgi:hypothetical protein